MNDYTKFPNCNSDNSECQPYIPNDEDKMSQFITIICVYIAYIHKI